MMSMCDMRMVRGFFDCRPHGVWPPPYDGGLHAHDVPRLEYDVLLLVLTFWTPLKNWIHSYCVNSGGGLVNPIFWAQEPIFWPVADDRVCSR
jgi:hypothetical protein